MNRWHVASLILFGLSIIFLSGRDWIVHGLHYDYGLRYDIAWAQIDWNIYLIQLYVAAFSCAFIARSWKLLLGYCAFVWSSTQDLIFYGVWMQGKFPAGDWTWMGYYSIFGVWTTFHQFIFSFTILSLTIIGVYGVYLYVATRVHKNNVHLA